MKYFRIKFINISLQKYVYDELFMLVKRSTQAVYHYSNYSVLNSTKQSCWTSDSVDCEVHSMIILYFIGKG